MSPLLAQAGDWLVSLILYASPVVATAAALWERRRERRRGPDPGFEHEPVDEESRT